MRSPVAWRGRAASPAYALTLGVELGLSVAFSIASAAAYWAGSSELGAIYAISAFIAFSALMLFA